MTKYRPEIDGLRTIAVVAVIIFHLNSNFLIGGYYGVDVFFVISGYLITSILIKGIRNETFKMSDFWLKRVKRIIPLLLTVIITTIIILPFLIFRPTYIEMLKDIIPAIFSYFNFHAYFNFGDYWGQAADNSFFLHTWSLSIEEQFYLIYPFVLIIIHKFFKTFLIPLLLLTIFSLGLFIYFVNLKPQFTFYMLPFRIWELSIGGVITSLPKNIKISKINKQLLPLLGLILILTSYFFATKSLSQIAVLPVLGASFIIYFSSGNDFLGKILSSKIFVHIGKLSYSLYLWHWPIIVLFNNLEYRFITVNKLYIYVLLVMITYILSFLSYKLVETKLRHNSKTPKLVLVGIGGCILLIAFFKSSYFDIHYDPLYNQQTYYLKYYDVSPTQLVLKENNPRIFNVLIPNRLESNKDAYKKQGILKIVNNKNPEILILGDSHGVAWAKTLQNIGEELQLSSSVYTTNATRPFFNIKDLGNQESNFLFTKRERIDFAKSIISNISKWKIKIVITSCRWEQCSDKDKLYFEDLIIYLKKKDIKLLIINQPPRISIMEDLNAVQFISYMKINPINGFNSLKIDQIEVIKGNQFLNELSKKHSNVFIFDIFRKLYKNGKSKITYNEDVLYFDDDHLSYSCTELYKEDLKEIINDYVQ